MTPLVALLLQPSAHAAEVQFEGFYRARGRAFDTLSLDRTSPLDEGLAALLQHRLWLKPSFLVSDQVGLYVELKGLDGVVWGDQVGAYDTALDRPPTVFEYDLTAPTSTTDDSAPLLDLTLWRVYGEIRTDVGQFTFGRVPLHWGTGLWLNDGVHVDPDQADYGDTTDRVMWEMLIQDQFFLRAGVDVPVERFVGVADDTTAYHLAVAYRQEDLVAGVLLQLDHTGARQQSVDAFNLFTVDLAGEATLGKLGIAAEAVGQFGGGDLDGGINDVNATTFGAALHANMDLDAFQLSLRGGLATGDKDPNDPSLRTYVFDRDYSVGMFLFEQPMPVFATAEAAANDTNGGRDFSEVVTGNALSNALFVKPTVSRRIVDGFWADASWIGARAAKLPKIEGVDQRRNYGSEFQLGVRYEGIQHLAFGAKGALFMPGAIYSVAADGTTVTGFDDPAVGLQVTGRIDF